MDKYLLDGHKLYWHLDRVYQWQQGELVAPIYLELSPVSYCDHNCIFCGKDFVQVEHHKLETELANQRLRELGRLGLRSLMFAGEGEPLLHSGLEEMVATAKKSGIDVSITTNGSRGNTERWRRILPHLTWLRFSVDAATPETYARVHGVSLRTFSKTLHSIQEALEVRRELDLPVTIGTQFLALEENLGDLEEAMHLFSDVGVDYLAIKAFSQNPHMLKRKDVHYQQQMLDHIGELVERHQDHLATKVIFRKRSMTNYMHRGFKFRHCHALPFWGYISASGDVFTCAEFVGDPRFRVGNVNRQSMEEILFGPDRRHSVEFASAQLEVQRECRVNCRMARVNEFMDILAHKPEHANFI